MTVITISTVGYGTVRELSPEGMVFTILLIGTSIGIVGFLLSRLSKLFLDGEYRKLIKIYAVNRKVKKIKNHVIICGFGRNGRQAAIDLLKMGEKVIIIEKYTEVVDNEVNEFIVKNKNLVFIYGDASFDETLYKSSVENAKALITTLPNDGDNLLIVLTAKDLNTNLTVISRASDEHSYSKLKRAGATNVIMPDIVGGARMAKLVMQPDIVEFVEMIMMHDESQVHIEEIDCEDMASCIFDTKLSDLDIRKKTGANIIGLKLSNGELIFNPQASTIISKGDKLFVLGTPVEIQKLRTTLTNENYLRNNK